MANRVSRIEVSIPTASTDGNYYGRYPTGNAPLGGNILVGAAVAAAIATGTLTSAGLTVTKTVNPSKPLGGSPQNFQTIASAIASQGAGDVIRLEAGAASTPSSPYVYAEQMVFKSTSVGGTAASGTPSQPINWFVRAGDYIRCAKSFGLITTGYSAGTTDSAVGQGLLHFENVSNIILNLLDSTGTVQALEFGDRSQWNPGSYGTTGTPITTWGYTNYQALTIVSSTNCILRGALIHGAAQYDAGYGGSDCFGWTFDTCWWDAQGTNYGFQNAQGTIEAAGNMFDWHGHDSLFINCKSTFCGHTSGPAIWGYNNKIRFCDFSGDWRSSGFNTGKPYGYSGTIYSSQVSSAIPTLPFPFPTSTVCGPNVYERCRFSGCGPGELSGVPFLGFPSFGTIMRRCVFVNGNQGGHNVLEANVSNPLASSAILCIGGTEFHHNSVSGTPGLYDATDAGITAAAHPKTYGEDRFLNNAFDGNTDSGSPGPYFIRHYQITSFCGNNPYPRANKGSQIINNVLNAAAASGAKDSSNNVYSRTLSFGSYFNGAIVTDCDWLDNGVTFPGDVLGNLLQPITWLNQPIALTGTLTQALAGLVLDPAHNAGCIGTAAPLSTVTAAGSNLTSIAVTNVRPFWDGRSVPGDTPDLIAIQPAAGGTPVLRQLATNGIDYTGNHLTLTTPVTVGVGDKIYYVADDGVTPVLNRGCM